MKNFLDCVWYVATRALALLAATVCLLVLFAGIVYCTLPAIPHSPNAHAAEQPAPTPPAPAGVPVVRLPAELHGKPGRLLRLQAEADGPVIRWVSASEEADLIPSESGKWAIFSAATVGRYRVLAWTARGDVPSEAAVCVVVIEGSAPPGPGPGPEPAEPTDPFFSALKAAWMQEPEATRVADRGKLAALYRVAAGSTVLDAKLMTSGDLLGVLHAAAVTAIGDRLPAVRRAVAVELDTKVSTNPASPLDDAARKTWAAQLARLAALLEALR